jgi:hypothetical protein
MLRGLVKPSFRGAGVSADVIRQMALKIVDR